MAKEQTAKPRNDAYTGLLAVSFLALVGASVLMALDAQELGTAPQPLKVDVPGAVLGKAGDPLRKGSDPAPGPMMPPMMPPPMMMKNDAPAKLPSLPIGELPQVPPVVPASGNAIADDLPPIPVAPFTPPK
jgi:hypothetical protein